MLQYQAFLEELLVLLIGSELEVLCTPAPIVLNHFEGMDYACYDVRAHLAFAFLPYELFIYRMPLEATHLDIRSALCWLRNGDFTRHLGSHGPSLRLFYLPSLLPLALSLIPKLTPGRAVYVHGLTSEVLFSEITPHPLAAREETISLSADTCLSRSPIELEEKRLVPDSGRSHSIPELDRFCGPISIISAERQSHARKGVPSFITQICWSTGADKQPQRTFCGGKHRVPAMAQSIARAEALERFQVIYPDQGADLFSGPTSIHPACVSPQQDFAFPDCDESQELLWTTFRDLSDDSVALVPAEDVWFYPKSSVFEASLVRPTTSGCALGGSLVEATIFALLEYMERDAYLTRWYLRKYALRIDPETIQSRSTLLLLAKLRFTHPQYRLYFYSISLDVDIPIVTVAAERLRGTGGKTFHATAAALTLEGALESALTEIAMLLQTPYSRSSRERSHALAQDPDKILSSEDHRLLYMHDSQFERAHFLSAPDASMYDVAQLSSLNLASPGETVNLSTTLRLLAGRISSLGMRVMAKDITHAGLRNSGLYCVRALVTQMSPMWYGEKTKRINRSARMARLDAELPGSRACGSPYVTDCHPFS